MGSIATQSFGHRGYRLGCKVVSSLVPEQDVRIRLNADAVFSIPFADGYWSRLLNTKYAYEEEIEIVLRAAANIDYDFIDCGANFGYWSVLSSSRVFGPHAVLAIEASPANYRRLVANAELNGGRFRCLNAAIGAKTGGFVRITGARHEALGTKAVSLYEEGAVSVVSLDGLIDMKLIDPSRPTIIKLDVEGVEIDSIRGSQALTKRDTLFICEDHGADRDHAVSRFLLNEAGLQVFMFDPEFGELRRVESLDVIDRIKRHSWVGYNVFATLSDVWEKAMTTTMKRSYDRAAI